MYMNMYMNMDQKFLDLCEKGHFKEIEETFEIKEIIRNANLVLLCACGHNNIEMVKRMLELGADINVQPRPFESRGNPISIACTLGYIDIVKLLIDIVKLLIDIVKLLIDNGADINASAGFNYDIFKISCMNGNIEVIKFLISYNINDSKNRYGETGFMVACKYGHIEIVKLLLTNDNINDINVNGHSPLIYACGHGYIDIVKLLLENGANINHVNNCGVSGLIESCDTKEYPYNIHNDNSDLVKFLIDNGADLYQRDIWGHTAFMKACVCRKYKEAEILAINKVDISHKDLEENSILKTMFKLYNNPRHISIPKDSYMDIIKLIISYDDYKKHTDVVDSEDINHIEQYMKTDEYKILKVHIRDMMALKAASIIFSNIVLLSDNYLNLYI